ncbi:hypothetical protein R76706_02490 [Ralstonia mannitolilytica]|nr:hypothetical protein R76706_02490 [Ralstonia mannitolilytica]
MRGGSGHHRHHIVQRLLQVPRGLQRDRRTGGDAIAQRREQLVGRAGRIEPAAASRGQQDTHHRPLRHQTTSVLSVTSTLLRVAFEYGHTS